VSEKGLVESPQFGIPWLEFSQIVRATTALSVTGVLMALAPAVSAAPYVEVAPPDTNIVLNVPTQPTAAEGAILTTTGPSPGTNNITVFNSVAPFNITATITNGITATVLAPTTNGIVTIAGRCRPISPARLARAFWSTISAPAGSASTPASDWSPA
jgi:hypothetical protein